MTKFTTVPTGNLFSGEPQKMTNGGLAVKGERRKEQEKEGEPRALHLPLNGCKISDDGKGRGGRGKSSLTIQIF